MRIQTAEAQNNRLSGAQLRTFREFRRKLNEKVPDYPIAWVRPVKENMIEVCLEPQKLSYRKTHQAAKLAIEMEEKTGIFVILC